MKFKIMIIILLFASCINIVFANNDLNIHSKSAIAMDADSSVVLYHKNMNEKIYPASTTKILTAILAIENLDLNRSVVVSKSAISIPWDSSSIYLKEGEILTVQDLLYGLLLNSGNDAANVLAEAVSGDIETFVQLMNIKLKELGCTNTHFNNAHGYSDDNHYTTALDMAKILRYCIQNENFVKIMSTKSYIIEPTNKTNTKRYLKNTNRLILKKEDSVYARYYEYCIGGKTGYTDEAGRTLVTFAKKDNNTVIVTTFGANPSGSEDIRYTDAINLFEYSFNNFSKQTIAQQENYNFNYINIDKKLNYTIGLKEDINILLKNNQTPDISYSINIAEENFNNLNEHNKAQVPAGTITFNLTSENQETYTLTQELYLKDIQKYTVITNKSILQIVIISIAIFLILITLILIIKNKKHKSHKPNKSRKNRRIN